MWFFSLVFKRILCPSFNWIFSWSLRSNGKHVALCFYMCRCACVLGFQICFQIHSAFWLILARAYWMTCILLISYWLSLNEQWKNVKEKVSQACKSWPFPLHFNITFELIELEKWVWSHIDHHWISLQAVILWEHYDED